MTVEERTAALEARLDDLEAQLALVSGELLGFRCAFIYLISLATIGTRDLERARQQAFAQATDAIELDEIHTDEARAVLATVRKVFDLVEDVRRAGTDDERPSAP